MSKWTKSKENQKGINGKNFFEYFKACHPREWIIAPFILLYFLSETLITWQTQISLHFRATVLSHVFLKHHSFIRKNFNSEITKIMVSKMIKLTSIPRYSPKIDACFSQWVKKPISYKIFYLYFQGSAPYAIHFLKGKGDAHWSQLVYDITDGRYIIYIKQIFCRNNFFFDFIKLLIIERTALRNHTHWL